MNEYPRPTLRAFLATGKFMLPVLTLAALLSGFRAGLFCQENVESGAPPILITLVFGWLGGTLLGPSLLSWLPGNSTSFKGWAAGILALVFWPAACLPLHLTPLDVTMAILLIPALTSLLTTRFAAPGEEWRKSAPLQLPPIAFAAGIWIMARFI